MNILCKAIPLFFVLGGAVMASDVLVVELVDILLVDDNAISRAVASRAVKRASIESGVPINLTEAVDGQDGWEQFSKRPDAFGMVITDQNMPKMNGDELTSHIRQSEKGSQTIIILNSTDESTLKNHSSENIFDSVVGKSANQLCETVKTFLTGSRKNSLE